jgi:hypothetical protein
LRRRFFLRRRGRRPGRLGLRHSALRLAQFPRQKPRSAAQNRKRQHRHAGQHGDADRARRNDAKPKRVGGELLGHRLVGGAVNAGLRNQQAGRHRDHQGRDLRHQAVADGEQHIGAPRFAEIHPVRGDADDDAADDVDRHNQQSGNRVAAHELARAVHGAEEGAFVLQIFATFACLSLIDEACREIGVDRHLLAGHGV